MTTRHLIPAIALMLLATATFANPKPQQLANFLSTTATFQGDGTFMTVKGELPRSYFSTPDYWGGYVCSSSQTSCLVKDTPRMEGENFILNGKDSSGAALQIERVDATQGTDIYDAATWQIAIALAAKNHLIDKDTANTDIDNVNKRLSREDVRATGENFLYGYQSPVDDPNAAYSYRMLGQFFLAQDPLANTQYSSYIQFAGDAKDKAELYGKVTWADWKPITGENAWAFFIGPLQADHIRYVLSSSNPKQSYVPFSALSIQHAIALLPTVELMQAGNGGIFYAPFGSAGNEGPITEGAISTENCLSMYAGLHMLKQVLINTEANDPQAPNDQIEEALARIDNILNGTTTQPGLISYLKNDGFDQTTQQFIQGGIYQDGQWIPEQNMKAVDVNTWGIAALSPKTIDAWFGKGTAFNVWENTKQFGSYCADDNCESISGVGFSDQDGHQIFSGEWSFGAINAVRELANYYHQTNTLSDEQTQILENDLNSMQKSIELLRTDNYATRSSEVDGIKAQYQVKLPENQVAYLYANKRYHIPFGWYANPIPSVASSSWAMMNIYDFNPFQLGPLA